MEEKTIVNQDGSVTFQSINATTTTILEMRQKISDLQAQIDAAEQTKVQPQSDIDMWNGRIAAALAAGAQDQQL